MPTGKNWVNFIYINVAFVLYILGVFYYSKLKEIKDNWPLYRCNPLYMPLADDINSNFSYCIQNMQSEFMGYLLQPLTYITSVLGEMITSFVEQFQAIRAMFDKIRNFLPNIFNNIFNAFSVLIIEFQRIAIGIRDMMGKITGLMITIMYLLEGSIKTMTSGYNFVSGKCFHPDTLVALKNGKNKPMKDLDLGDILINGSIVEAVMKIDNKKDQIPFYIIKGAGVNDNDIYVTGSHFVYDKTSAQYIKIEDYSNAELTNIKSDWFSCLITSDHKIHIGNELFWDWEDYLIRMNLV
jgi:hypothetical protein